MNNLVFTNDKENFNLYRQSIPVQNETIEIEGEWLLSFNPLRSKYLQFDGDDFVLISGSIVEGVGFLDNLSEFFQDFCFDSPSKSFERLVGAYCIILKKGATLFMSSDKNGMYKVYYKVWGNNILFSTSYFFLSYLPSTSLLSLTNLLELSFQYSIQLGETIFQDIWQLADKYIVYNESQGFIFGNDLKKFDSIKIDSHAEAVEHLSALLKKYAESIVNQYKKITISMTGGFDSRLILAAFLAVGAKPKLIYGQGNSAITNTKNRDLELCKLISERFGLPLSVMDWSSSKLFDETTIKRNLNRYSDYFVIYGSNSNFFHSLETELLNTDFIEFGYFGETLRNLGWIEDYGEDKISINKLFRKYLYSDLSPFVNNTEIPFEDRLREKLQVLVNRINEGGDLSTLALEDFQKFHSSYRYSADTMLLNLCNLYTNSFSLLGLPQVQHYISNIPRNLKIEGRLQIELINQLYPELMNVPFFSHTKEVNVDATTLKIIEPVSHKVRKLIYRRIVMAFKASKIGTEILLRLKNRFYIKKDRHRSQAQLVDRINVLLKTLNISGINFSGYAGDLRALVRFYLLLILIHEARTKQTS